MQSTKSATRTNLHLWNSQRRRKRWSQRLPRDFLSGLELQQRAKGPVKILLGDFLSRNPCRITAPRIKKHRVRPRLERLHPTLEKRPDDVHAVHFLLRNQLEILHPTIKGLYLLYLAIQNLVFPGSFWLDDLGGVK